MGAHEISLKRKARLYIIRHLDALIESASWVKGKHDGLRLVVGMLVTDESGTNGRLTHLFSQHPNDQKRLERLCDALELDPLFFTLDDLVGRRIGIAERIFETRPGEARSIVIYRTPKESSFHRHQRNLH
jgi:hypothetical protein